MKIISVKKILSEYSSNVILLVPVAMPFGMRTTIYAVLFWILVKIKELLLKNSKFFPKWSFAQSILVIYFFAHIFGLFYTNNISNGLLVVEHNLLFLLVPVIFSIEKIDNVLREKILIYFSLSNLLVLLLTLIMSLWNSVHIINKELIFNASVLNQDQSFGEAINQGGNFFFGEALSWFMPSTYFALYLLFSLLILTNRFRVILLKYYFNKTTLLIFCSTLVIGILLLSSKAVLLSLLIFLFILILDVIFSDKLIWYKISIVVIFSVSILFVVKNPRVSSLIDAIRTDSINFSKKDGYLTSSTLRLMAWDASYDVIKENIFWGTGTGDVKDEISKVYTQKGYITALNYSLNSHNQFLQTWTRLGLIGLSILLSSFVYTFFKKNWSSFKIGWEFLIILFISFIFESILERFVGVIFFVFFYLILFVPIHSKRIL